MALYTANSTIRKEGLFHMLLVFGALPQPARMKPCPTKVNRQKAIEEGRKEVSKDQAKRRIDLELHHPGGKKAKEQSERLITLPYGSLVLVYRTTSRTWEGKFSYIYVEGETAVVQLHQGRKIFRTTCVKLWTKSILQEKYNPPDTDGN